MRRRAVHEQEAMRMLASSGFLFFQEGDTETGDLWLRILQQKPDRFGSFRPVDLTTLEVYQDRTGNLVVDARALQQVLNTPSQLPGDVVPESRLAMGTARPLIEETWSMLDEAAEAAEDEDEEDEDDLDDDDAADDDDDPDYANEFSRMGARE